MDNKKYFLRLSDIDDISNGEINLEKIVVEVFGFKKRVIGSKYVLRNKIKQALVLIDSVNKIDISKINPNGNSGIKMPKSVDFITFRAMMELQAFLSNPREGSLSDKIAKTIAIVCFSENYSGKYSSNDFRFKWFISKIKNSDLIDTMGIYNWIEEQIKESTKTWEERFMSVKVEDKDYERAGGSAMAQFNIVNTIKRLCNDFNVDYESAWQLSYNLTQTNSYGDATYNHIQDKMRQLKELKMKQNRSKGS